MNRYETSWYCKCPVNGIRILYQAKIETKEVIAVEELLEYIDKFYKDGFHELIADDLKEKFGGKQTITANHHSVTITTER